MVTNTHAHLEDLCTHLSGGAPLTAELYGEGLSVLGENAHTDRVDQNGDHTQPLLLHRVEQDHVPAVAREGETSDSASKQTITGD